MFRVLIIDHSITRANVTTRALQALEFGVRVNYALSATQAMLALASSFTSNKSIPDMIIMSDMLPDVSGLDTLETLIDSVQAQGIPVIVLAGSPQPQDSAEYFKSGAAAYIPGSVSLADRIAKISECVSFVAMVKGLIPRQPQFFSTDQQTEPTIGEILQVYL